MYVVAFEDTDNRLLALHHWNSKHCMLAFHARHNHLSSLKVEKNVTSHQTKINSYSIGIKVGEQLCMLFIPIFWFVYIYQFIFPTCSRTFAKLWISWKRLVSLWKYYHSINVENGGTESRVNLCHLKQNLRLLFKKIAVITWYVKW